MQRADLGLSWCWGHAVCFSNPFLALDYLVRSNSNINFFAQRMVEPYPVVDLGKWGGVGHLDLQPLDTDFLMTGPVVVC